MQVSNFVLLALTGFLAASVPLALVWTATGVNKYRKLAWVIAFITFDLIVFGGFTRLTDSGLGCPDWPGCYGEANPFLAHAHIAAAEALMPTGPVTKMKAWIEMVHRFLAMGIGFLIIVLVAASWRQWSRARKGRAAHPPMQGPIHGPALPTLLLLWVCVQGAFGAWTVTLKLQPVIVTLHLLFGMTMLAMAVWLGGREDKLLAPPAAADPRALQALRRLRPLAWLSGAVLLVQLALGGWVSTNYATLACNDFPLCNGQLVPEMDFEHGFTLWRELGKTAAGHYIPFAALTAIHWVHRNFAAVVVLVLCFTAWRAWRIPGLHKTARNLVLVVIAQALTGIATVFLNFPLVIAVLHNAGAALLVLLVTMLNYKVQHQLDLAPRLSRRQTPAPASHS
ncbi:heme A synthase [Herbaspirillum sp. SJZ107]|uniref:COX15/CtaA family protein n=1 Tax=Herbaspirillum sp. SJZ107 TaxID=2572881 RepID=UPI0011543F94|nr:COX15/CtaA family protein [Herbaspirillum sp. SJZ107]TQK02729.1 cytochrome c oxidase assembly protein subunit 15 [Herbaspirillum sp. SJZ107]